MGYWDKKEKAEPKETLETFEKDCKEELTEAEQGFRERMKNEENRFLDMCDTEYWFCVCFTSRAQKEELLKSLGINPEEKYIDGRDFAQAAKRPLQTPDLQFSRIKGFDKDYVARANPVNKGTNR